MKPRSLSDIWSRNLRSAKDYISVGIAHEVRANAVIDPRGTRAPAAGFRLTEYDFRGMPVDSFMTADEFFKKTEPADTAPLAVALKEFPTGTRVVKDELHSGNSYAVIAPDGSISIKGHYSLHTQFNLRASQLEGEDVRKTYTVFTRKDVAKLRGISFPKQPPVEGHLPAEPGAVLLYSTADQRLFLAQPNLARVALRLAPK